LHSLLHTSHEIKLFAALGEKMMLDYHHRYENINMNKFIAIPVSIGDIQL